MSDNDTSVPEVDEEDVEDNDPSVPSDLLDLHTHLEEFGVTPEEFKEAYGNESSS